MNEHDFRKFLKSKSLSESSIDHYCSYIRSIIKAYGFNAWDKAVDSKDITRKHIANLVNGPMFLQESSARCYRRALCLLYECKYSETIQNVRFSRLSAAKLVFPESAKDSWYQTIIVDMPHEWLNFATKLNQSSISRERSWAFRGQGDATWGMETSLGRIIDYQNEDDVYTVGSRLRSFEKETMWEFRREASKDLEYRGFCGIDLLALVQHYGGRTRLLDFTIAPLLALYMSVEQSEIDFARVKGYAKEHQGGKKLERPDFAVWAIDLHKLGGKSKSSCQNSGCNVEHMLHDAEQTLIDGNEDQGVHVVFPKTCNERISAQDGLFLMPKSLEHSFEENLRYELMPSADIAHEELQCKKLSEYRNLATDCHISEILPPVVKFVFSGCLFESIKRILREANVTAKHVYPDLTGLGKFVSGIIEEHCQDRSHEE